MKILALIIGLSVAAVSTTTPTLVQEDKSKKILSELSKKAEGFTTVKASFTKTYTKGAVKDVSKGKITVKGTKFFVETGEGQNLYCDGRTVVTHLIEDEEAYCSPASELSEDGEFIEPSEMFTIWEKDFKYRYLKEQTISGTKYDVINLVPLKPKEKKYHTIQIKVNKTKKTVDYFIISFKDGSTAKYHITSFKTNETVSDAMFKFNKAKFPDVIMEDC